MLKVLYLPLNDADNVQQGMYDAWNQVGVNLQIFDFHRQWLNTKNSTQIQADFIRKAQEFQPHLIHMQLQFTGLIQVETLAKVRHVCPNVIITNWSGDIRTEAIHDFVSLTHTIDYALISSTGQLDLYKRAGCANVKYWQVGFDPKFSYPVWNTEFKYDASFTGNCYPYSHFPDAKLRVDAVIQLRSYFGSRFGLFGAGYDANTQQCSPKQINQIYNDSICPISISNFNNVSHYFSDRLLACLGSGRPVISWHFPGIESYFIEGSEILVARSTQDIIDAVNFCKANPEKANAIGKNGYRRVLKEHTFVSRILELLSMTKLLHLL